MTNGEPRPPRASTGRDRRPPGQVGVIVGVLVAAAVAADLATCVALLTRPFVADSTATLVRLLRPLLGLFIDATVLTGGGP